MKSIFVAMIAVALMSYGSDCLAMTNPQQAMGCCKSMHCSPQGHHGQDCCKTSPSIHAPFLASASVQVLALDQAPALTVAEQSGSPSLRLGLSAISAYSHAPPQSSSPPSIPIRI